MMCQWSFHVKAFCLFLVLYAKEQDGKGAGCLVSAANGQLPSHTWSSFADKMGKFPNYEVLTRSGVSGISKDEISGLARLVNGSRKEANRRQLLNKFKEPRSSLQLLAVRVMEALDRISRNWAVEGAKTIQNGEIKLRKLYRDFSNKVVELVANESKHGQHILGCLNQTVFRMGLDRILGETTNCYSKSLEAIQRLMRKLEEHENDLLRKMESYAQKIFDMLSECFVKDSSSDIIKCLQEVDVTGFGREMRHKEAMKLVTEMNEAISDIPKIFSECNAKGLAETEAHIRRGYATSLTCLKKN